MQDRLYVEGRKIKNKRNMYIQLHGINLGGWLMREGWMDGSGACEHPVKIQRIWQKEKSLMIDLGSIRRVNRIHMSMSFHGRYEIYITNNWVSEETGEYSWRFLFGGIGEDEVPQKFKEGRAVPYSIEGNAYDQGCGFCLGKFYMNTCSCRYIRLYFPDLSDTEWETFKEGTVRAGLYDDVDDFTARAVLEQRFGTEQAEWLLEKYQKAYITEKDLEYIKKSGFNFVRVPVYWQEVMDKHGNFKVGAWENIDWLVEQCTQKELYVMLDYHGAPGGHTGGSITCGQLGANELWNNAAFQEMSCRIVKTMALRYVSKPTVALIDLLNEPMAAPDFSSVYADHSTGDSISRPVKEEYKKKTEKMYMKLYDAVRSVNKEIIVSMQPFLDYDLLKAPKVYGWENVIYQIHTYGAGWRDHDSVYQHMEKALAMHEKYLEIYNVPILAGEFCFWEFYDVWEQWLEGLNNMGIHWASWSYKIIDTNSQDNWSVFYHFNGELADVYRDSPEVIARCWQNFSTEQYVENKTLAALLSRYAKVTK